MVTPTYYVTFTFCTLVTSVILYKGLKASGSQIMTVVLAFFVICTGIFILQMSKVDPRKLSQVDEHTTLLLEAARQEVDPLAVRKASIRRSGTLRSRRSELRSRTSSGPASNGSVRSDSMPQVSLAGHITGEDDPDELGLDFDLDDVSSTHEIVQKTEEPGLDSLRGTFGAIGTIIRAKRRARAFSAASHARSELSQHTNQDHSAGSGEMLRTRSGSGGGLHPNMRPSWLPHGPWSTPKGSRFQAMEIPGDDIEKGKVEMIEKNGSSDKVVVTPGSFGLPGLFASRSPSPTSTGQGSAANIQLNPSKGSPLATLGASDSEKSGASDKSEGDDPPITEKDIAEK